MYGIPRFAGGREEVSAGPERGEFILSEIVRLGGTGRMDPIHAAAVLVVIQRHRCLTNRVSSFVQNLAGDDRVGREAEQKVFGVNARAGHNRSGKLIVLFVAGRNKSAFGAGQRILPRRQPGKFIFAVLGSDHKLKLSGILRVSNGYSRADQWTAVRFAHDGAGNSIATG